MFVINPDRPIRIGAVVGMVCAAMAAVITAYAIQADSGGPLAPYNDPVNYLGAGFSFLLSVGLWFRSRVCAILLSVSFVAACITNMVLAGRLSGLAPCALITLVLLWATWACFVYHHRGARERRRGVRPVPMTPAGYLVVLGALLAIPFLCLPFLAANVFMVFLILGPSPELLTGEELAARHLAKIEEARLLLPDERIVLFYSAGLFSVLEDGNALTDQRVISYTREGRDFWVESAFFDEIHEAYLCSEGGIFSDAELVIVTDETDFVLYVPAADADRLLDAIIDRIGPEAPFFTQRSAAKPIVIALSA